MARDIVARRQMAAHYDTTSGLQASFASMLTRQPGEFLIIAPSCYLPRTFASRANFSRWLGRQQVGQVAYF